MTLPTIKADVAAEDANSYITIDEADEILGGSDVWDGLSNIQKTRYLLQSTQLLDSREFVGNKYNPNQALEFPRNFQIDAAGVSLLYWIVKYEQAYIALWLAQNYGEQADINEIDLDEVRIRFNEKRGGYRFTFIDKYIAKNRLVVKE